MHTHRGCRETGKISGPDLKALALTFCFTRFMFVYAGVVILGFHSYWLDFSFNLFIWKNMNSFGSENIWVVLWLFVLLKSPQEKHRLISRNTIPLLQPEEPQNFHSSCPFPFSLQYILLQDYLCNTLFATNRYFSPWHFHLVFQNRKDHLSSN